MRTVTVSDANRKNALSPDEMDRLHADDLNAGRIVVGLIAGVFVSGLLLYSLIWWLVREG